MASAVYFVVIDVPFSFLLVMDQVAESARTEGEAAQEAWRCRICLSADVNAVLVSRSSPFKVGPSQAAAFHAIRRVWVLGLLLLKLHLSLGRCFAIAVQTVCGHALCWNCGSACHQRCPFCRTYSPVIRLYK